MRFTMTANGAASLANALKNVAMLPAQLSYMKNKGEVEKLAQAFNAQAQMAKQRQLDSSTSLNKQKLDLIGRAAADPSMDLGEFNRLSVLTGGKAYTPFEQGKGILDSAFNTATGEFSYGSPVAQAGVVNRVGALTGVDPATGAPLAAEQINAKNLAFSGKPFDQYGSVGNTGLSVDKITGRQIVGNDATNRAFNALTNAQTQDELASAGAHNASAAASRALAGVRNIELSYARNHGEKMPTASARGAGGGAGTGAGSSGFDMKPAEINVLFSKPNEFGMNVRDDEALNAFYTATKSRGLPANMNTAMAFRTGGEAALDAMASGAQAGAPAAAPAGGGASPVSRALSGVPSAPAQASGPDMSAYIKPRDAVDVRITAMPQFSTLMGKLGRNKAFARLPEQQKRQVVANIIGGMRGDKTAQAAALPYLR